MDQISTDRYQFRATQPVNGLADVVYSPQIEEGISRKAGKRGFLYYGPDGKRIRDRSEIERLNALAIPPAYTDVCINANPLAHLQATGIDARGRKQYRYHPDWLAERERAKFERLVEFGDRLPAIRERVDIDLTAKGLSMSKAVATVVWMLDKLYIRVGNQAYAEANGSFGLTTLRRRHIRIDGSTVRFRFKGKSGKEWNLAHADRRIAGVIRRLQDLPGQHLFKYLGPDGEYRQILSQDVNAYIREAAGEDFSSKQFRTWGATCMAAAALAPVAVGNSKRQITLQINAAIDAVAAKLVNTRAVCRSSYIHPAVFDDFRAGRLAEFASMRPSRSKRLTTWMNDEEIRTLRWLKTRLPV